MCPPTNGLCPLTSACAPVPLLIFCKPLTLSSMILKTRLTQEFSLKISKTRCRLGLRPRPHCRPYAASPDPLVANLCASRVFSCFKLYALNMLHTFYRSHAILKGPINFFHHLTIFTAPNLCNIRLLDQNSVLSTRPTDEFLATDLMF